MTDPVIEKSSSPDSKNESLLSLSIYLVVALGLAVLIRAFVAAPYVVSGSSMEPNFQDWNYLIVEKMTTCIPFTSPEKCFDFGEPQRGDVIVLKLPEDTSRALIKRVIGLPGDTVILSGSKPTVTIVNASHPNGFVLNEPYISSANYGGPTDMTINLQADQYFVLGDNRNVSADSRSWGILPRQDVVGRVILRLYPLNEIGITPAEARYDSTSTASTTQL